VAGSSVYEAERREGAATYYPPMPLFMDVHPGLGDATPEDVAEAHRHDLAIQDDFGVKFLSYWFADPQGKAFCLVEAPDADSAVACHKAAHGLMPHEIIEVAAPTLELFMGATDKDEHDRVTVDGRADTALRAIMFTDIEGSTAVSTRQGDQAAMELVHRHDQIVRDALERFGGREVKHTGDGVFASFNSVLRAVEASIAIQRRSADERARAAGPELAVKIGLTVGEPVEDSEDLFGASVNLAARICAHAGGGQTLAAGTVRDLTIGKNIQFVGQGAIGLKGFPDPVPLFEVGWAVEP
jgi:class 3 adenylate cyclase